MTKYTIFTIFIQFQLFAQGSINKDILRITAVYEDSLQRNGIKPIYFVLRLEPSEKGDRIFIANCNRLLPLINDEGVPDSYLSLKNQWVFVYSRETRSIKDNGALTRFEANFEAVLKKEIAGRPGFQDFSFNPYLFVVKGEDIVLAKKTCGFPFPAMLEKGETFDQYGNHMYSDGIYSICNLRIQGSIFRVAPMVLVREKTYDSLSSKNLGADIVIDTSGKVFSVHLEGKDIATLTEKTKSDLIKLLMDLPQCGIGYLAGRPVKYRIHVVL